MKYFRNLCILVFGLPAIIFIAFLCLIFQGRPIFYKQKRLGKDKEIFELWKFRTMEKDAESKIKALAVKNEAIFPFFKIKKDPRITKFGRLLRKTSIDELPQIINVLRGEMNLVGPRPCLPAEAPYLTEEHFFCLPGLTGPTQIYRNKNLTLEEYNQLDINYNKSPKKCQILLKTVLVIFKGV